MMAAVADEEILTLLREIRDSQNAYIELYKDAVKNQQSSIALQKQSVQRARVAQFVSYGIIILAIAVALLLAYH